jgi:hypothetical protein
MSAELLVVLLILGGAVATILFWALAASIAIAIGAGILLVLNFVWWLVTRPIVWPIRAIRWLFTGGPRGQSITVSAAANQAVIQQGIAQDIHDRAERLSRLKALLDTGALSEAEYARMKAEILG